MLISRSHTLADGSRVRLRLPHAGDRARLAALHERLGAPLDPLRVERILRFDPRRRACVCATLFDGSGEELVGYGHVDLGGEDSLVVGDEALAPGVAALVRAALAERAGGRHVA